MTTTNQICPICRAAANQPCLFKVKDGYQNKDAVHIERARLDYAIEALDIKKEDNESDLDFVLRVNAVLDYLAHYLTPPLKNQEERDKVAKARVALSK